MGLAPGKPSARPAAPDRAGPVPGWPLQTVRGWALWRLEPRLRGFLVVVAGAWLAAAGLAVTLTAWRAHDALTYLALLAFGLIIVEANRRLGEPAGVSRD